jgi:hypothetical protein
MRTHRRWTGGDGEEGRRRPGESWTATLAPDEGWRVSVGEGLVDGGAGGVREAEKQSGSLIWFEEANKAESEEGDAFLEGKNREGKKTGRRGWWIGSCGLGAAKYVQDIEKGLGKLRYPLPRQFFALWRTGMFLARWKKKDWKLEG